MKKKLFTCLMLISSLLTLNAQNLLYPYGGFMGNNNAKHPKIIENGWDERISHDYVSIYVAGNGDANPEEKIRINNNGNVGIGTPNPSYRLEVIGSFKAHEVNSGGNVLFPYGGFIGNNNAKHPKIIENGWDGRISHDYVSIYVAGNGDANPEEKIRINNNGNVGIGTPNPSYRLEVIGSFKAHEVNSGGNVLFPYGKFIGINNNDFPYKKIIESGWDGTDYVSIYVAGKGENNANEKIRINYNGNVGIGTSCPETKLDVIGTIRANEVKVSIKKGCDFVFENNYKLMDLEELEQFVKTKQHLPEIAPAKEMVENGVNMKEFQMKLLQKIEELTLYTIEQENKIKELEKQNQTIEELKRMVILQNEKIEKLKSSSK